MCLNLKGLEHHPAAGTPGLAGKLVAVPTLALPPLHQRRKGHRRGDRSPYGGIVGWPAPVRRPRPSAVGGSEDRRGQTARVAAWRERSSCFGAGTFSIGDIP